LGTQQNYSHMAIKKYFKSSIFENFGAFSFQAA